LMDFVDDVRKVTVVREGTQGSVSFNDGDSIVDVAD
jgi:hypothetical protein